MILLEVAKEMTFDKLAPYGDESVEFLVNGDLFCHAVKLIVPARPDSGIDKQQGPSGPGPKPDTKDDEQMDQDDYHMEVTGDKSNGLD